MRATARALGRAPRTCNKAIERLKQDARALFPEYADVVCVVQKVSGDT